MALIPYDRFGKGIYIESERYKGDMPSTAPEDQIIRMNFTSQVKMALNILGSKPIGKELLEAICSYSKVSENGGILIEWGLNATAGAVDDLSPGKIAMMRGFGGKATTTEAFKKAVRGQGGCKGARVLWNPSNIRGDGEVRPSYLPLAHELIHGLHYIAGDCARLVGFTDNINDDSGLAEEEARTVGLGPYSYPYHSDYFCENAIRYAFKQPLRTEYQTGIDLSQVKRKRL